MSKLNQIGGGRRTTSLIFSLKLNHALCALSPGSRHKVKYVRTSLVIVAKKKIIIIRFDGFIRLILSSTQNLCGTYLYLIGESVLYISTVLVHSDRSCYPRRWMGNNILKLREIFS